MGLEIINQLKKQKGWTNVDLANASGVPKPTIDKITAGTTTNPNFDTVWAIAEALDCSVDQFRDTKKSPAPDETGTRNTPNSSDFSMDLYKILVSFGLVAEGQDITLEQQIALKIIFQIIVANFGGPANSPDKKIGVGERENKVG